MNIKCITWRFILCALVLKTPCSTHILLKFCQDICSYYSVSSLFSKILELWHPFNLNQSGHFLFYIFPHHCRDSGVLLCLLCFILREEPSPQGFYSYPCIAGHFFRPSHLEEIMALDLRVLLPDLFCSFSQNCCVFLKIVVETSARTSFEEQIIKSTVKFT